MKQIKSEKLIKKTQLCASMPKPYIEIVVVKAIHLKKSLLFLSFTSLSYLLETVFNTIDWIRTIFILFLLILISADISDDKLLRVNYTDTPWDFIKFHLITLLSFTPTLTPLSFWKLLHRYPLIVWKYYTAYPDGRLL